MTSMTRKAGDPLGVVVPATVVCPGCHEQGGWGCQRCQGEGRIPNPVAWQTCRNCLGIDTATCPTCNGQGVTPRTLMIPEAVHVVEQGDRPVGWSIVVGRHPLGWRGWLQEVRPSLRLVEQDITHLWPASPCPECGGTRLGRKWHHSDPDEACRTCSFVGTVRTLPKPGEWWIVGHRPCELMPVVDEATPATAPLEIAVVPGDPSVLLWAVLEDGRYLPSDITSHFPDGLLTTDDLAGVCGELVLADEAVKP